MNPTSAPILPLSILALTAALIPIGVLPAGTPEAIASDSSLPPTAGEFQLWPPNDFVRFIGEIPYEDLMIPFRFDLRRIAAGRFTNVTRTDSGGDRILEFDVLMNTEVPYAHIDTEDLGSFELRDEVGRFRIRVIDGALRSTGRFSLVVESFSWTMRGRDDEGNPMDLIHVRLRDSRMSTGSIRVDALEGGKFVMQSDLRLEVEGALILIAPVYFPPSTGPIRLALRGTARELDILAVANIERTSVELGTYRLLQLDVAHMGPDFRYGIDYTTDGREWHQHTWIDFWGEERRWMTADAIANWGELLPTVRRKLYRVIAEPYP